MRVIFDLHCVGLGNNGGSRTLIKCAEALRGLGVDAQLFSPANKYNWHKHSVPIVKKMPHCDVVVATGFGSVAHTMSCKAKGKFYYIRGFELWQASEKRLLKSYRSLSCIVNSEWLKSYMVQHGIDCSLVYPGLDVDDFYIEHEKREDVIGGIFSHRHKTKRHSDVISIGERLGYNVLLLNRDIRSPSVTALREFYNRIKVWVSPSELEGLHNCPSEAALCGCCLVVTDHPRGGTSDYATDKTSLRYSARDLEAAAEHVERLMQDDDLRSELQFKMLGLLKTKIGTRHENMRKMIEAFLKGV